MAHYWGNEAEEKLIKVLQAWRLKVQQENVLEILLDNGLEEAAW